MHVAASRKMGESGFWGEGGRRNQSQLAGPAEVFKKNGRQTRLAVKKTHKGTQQEENKKNDFFKKPSELVCTFFSF